MGGGKLSGLLRQRIGGYYYVRHRATGIRMPDHLPEDHPDFLDAYRDAQRQAETGKAPARGRAKAGTLAALWTLYQQDAAFLSLSSSYRAVRRRDGDRLIGQPGAADVPIAQIRAHHIRADLAALAPNAARERRKTWRALCRHALDMGLIADDPSAQVAAPRAPAATQRAPWSATDRAAFRARWPLGSPQRLAFELLWWTGARIGDVVRMGPGMIDDKGWLHFRQCKTGGKVWIPLDRAPPEIADARDLAQLRAAIEARSHSHLTWLTTDHGTSRSVKAASQWLSKAARAAGLIGKTAHGLRVSRAIALAEAGATHHQIGAWTGHESLKEIAHYSRDADRRRLLSGPDREQTSVKTRDVLTDRPRNALKS